MNSRFLVFLAFMIPNPINNRFSATKNVEIAKKKIVDSRVI